MRLTAFTDYSLRVLMHLAAAPERRATVAEIAAAFDISEHHLTKVVHFLAKKGWIATVRGKGGGMTLARPAEEIPIGGVVRDSEGNATLVECFGTGQRRCAIASCCGLQAALAEAETAFYRVLDGRTLADITHNRAALAGILHVRAPVAAARVSPAPELRA